MTRITLFLLFAVLCTSFFSCRDELDKDSKYSRPDWLAGKVYTQVKEEPELSTFAQCIERIGYDTIINRSGSYTVFAPTNEAFSLYFDDHPGYNTIEDIPFEELSRLVKFHIVQNPWSKIQLRTLDIYGWIDTLDIDNDEPKGFKRETLLLDKDIKVGVEASRDGMVLVDTLGADLIRRIATDSRKYAPFFYSEYFDIYNLPLTDYEYYFNRSIDNSADIYFSGAKIQGDEIFAENGFVYMIDRVVDPLPNAYQMLKGQGGLQESYTDFLDLFEYFPDFEYNEEKTENQPGYAEGLKVDSLFNLTFPDLTFDITNERTDPPTGTFGLPANVTVRYHHGLIAPTNAAFSAFVDEYLSGSNSWGSIKGAPRHIKRIIANTHMSLNPIYPTDFNNGFFNGERDYIVIDEASIIEKQFGSNCTFLGVDQVVVPRAFTSVAYPAYLRRSYSKMMWAIEQTGLLSALKREKEPGEEYMFFIATDLNTTLDSSLVYYPRTERFTCFQISGAQRREFPININDLRVLLLNHIGTRIPEGIANKEFVKNLAGNYLTINNITGEVRGTAPTTDGYRGLSQIQVVPALIAEADNGNTYDISDFFSFTSTTIYLRMENSFQEFHALLQKAGLTDDAFQRYTFISDSENYTVFAPSNDAINNSGADTLNIQDLRKFLRLHFVQGNIIFTDGSEPSGYYETVRVDEKSTTYSTVFTQLYIDPGYDEISIPAKDGTDYLTIDESARTNILTGRNLGTQGLTGTFPNVINNAVIHEINKVLVMDEVDTR